MAGIDLVFDNEITPINLAELLQKVMPNSTRTENTIYLRLPYIVDISENKISELCCSNSLRPSEQVKYFNLRREWQKFGIEINTKTIPNFGKSCIFEKYFDELDSKFVDTNNRIIFLYVFLLKSHVCNFSSTEPELS